MIKLRGNNMLYYVAGQSGAGKSQYLVEEANKEKEKDISNIVYITTDEERNRILDHNVRVINAKSYDINCKCSFRGFLAGILARDYDIGKVYVDGIYELVDINKDNIEKLSEKLSELSEYAKADIYVGLDWSKEDIPETIKAEVIQANL